MKKKIFALAAMLVMALTASAGLTLKTAAGAQECAYMEFTGLSDSYKMYNAYVCDSNGAQTQLDGELIRSYGTYGRVDALGLKAGKYSLKVMPVDEDGDEIPEDAVMSEELTVTNYDRSGFAHAASSGWTAGVGAYNNDGTLKAGAKVLYITKATAKTATMAVTTDAKGGKTTFTGLQAIVAGYQKGYETTPLCVRFIGMIESSDMDGFDSSAEGLQIKGKKADTPMNMTFEGVGNDAFIRGFGFLIRNAQSVEFRNFGIKTEMDDDLSFDTDNAVCWIHNMDLFYGAHEGGDHAKGDGALDIKGNSKYVTASYNRFWDTGKSSMCGMKQDSEPNYITYHHNWFDHSDSRHARVRTMSVHMYNNYYDCISKYGVGATNACSIFMESNYFKKCAHPMLISMQGTDAAGAGTFSGEDGGIIKAYGNYMDANCGKVIDYSDNNTNFDCYTVSDRNATVPSSVKTLQGGTAYDNFDTTSNIMYSYTADAAADVPAKVSGENGAGRLQHGDFTYTWTTLNEGSDWDETLYNKLMDYTSSFVKIIGKESSDPTPTPDPGKTASTFAITSNTTVSLTAPATSPITYENNAGIVTFTSGDEAVATVSESGVITAVGNGSTNIYVSDPGSETVMGATKSVKVVVSKPVSGQEIVSFTNEEGVKSTTNEALVQIISANIDNKSGSSTYEYGGVKYTVLLKMEGTTKLEITPTKDASVTFVFTSVNKIDLSSDGGTTKTKYTASSDGTCTVDLKSGNTYQMTKNSGTNDIVCITFDFGEPTGINEVNANPSTGSGQAINANANANAKYLRNGKLLIVRDGKTYNAAGAQIK